MPPRPFTLDPILHLDTVEVARLELCRVLLMRDQTYPWLILVPARAGLRDLDDLDDDHQHLVMGEISATSRALKTVFSPHKINVAALGNVVEQLHIHVIARFKNDPAWPAPVWGAHPAVDYPDAQRSATVDKIRGALAKPGPGVRCV